MNKEEIINKLRQINDEGYLVTISNDYSKLITKFNRSAKANLINDDDYMDDDMAEGKLLHLFLPFFIKYELQDQTWLTPQKIAKLHPDFTVLQVTNNFKIERATEEEAEEVANELKGGSIIFARHHITKQPSIISKIYEKTFYVSIKDGDTKKLFVKKINFNDETISIANTTNRIKLVEKNDFNKDAVIVLENTARNITFNEFFDESNFWTPYRNESTNLETILSYAQQNNDEYVLSKIRKILNNYAMQKYEEMKKK